MGMSSIRARITPEVHLFQLPLVVTATAIIFSIAAPSNGAYRMTGIFLTAAAVLLTLHAADVVASRRHAVAAILLVGTVMASVGTVAESAHWVRGIGELIIGIPIIWACIRTVIWIAEREVITGQAVLGGVLVYLLIGLLFGQIYGSVADLAPGNLFCEQGDGTQSDRVYFSFSTITTTGFGDFVPCSSSTHAIAITEAVFGQVYLVTIIALLVGNMGRRRSRPGDDEV
ncbi:MAG: hypothetical protein F2799_02110 [Actinobacteria bacterium]|uniref:Unannotated protein n=1 Tax=freshwater metagenome TaxID=449393 RepID=A0A6J7DDS8_9ZZZZ|nr:hypothetical protein [Actinomycetota bacterium]